MHVHPDGLSHVGNTSPLCSRCVLPLGIPGVSYTEERVCEYCVRAERENDQSLKLEQERALTRILDRHRGRGQYDCLIGLSGGKDSTFVLYLAVTKYKLRPLAINVDTGYRSKDAVDNIMAVTSTLNVDLITYTPCQKDYRELQTEFLKTTGEFCTPCLMLIDNIAETTASRFGIKLILSGSADRNSTAIGGHSIASYYDNRYFTTIASRVLNRRQMSAYRKCGYVRKAVGRITGTLPVLVNVLQYDRHSITEIIETLSRELSWKQPLGELEHGDCVLDHIKDYLLFRRIGCSERSQLLSMMVRSGEISRR